MLPTAGSQRSSKPLQQLPIRPASATRQDLTHGPVLFWPVGAYLVIYSVRHQRVEIVAISHGARDIPTFLGARTL
jgi:antitoxin ParD1/3/4/toxin ParE1/3/4